MYSTIELTFPICSAGEPEPEGEPEAEPEGEPEPEGNDRYEGYCKDFADMISREKGISFEIRSVVVWCE